jgi:hypothetical protein
VFPNSCWPNVAGVAPAIVLPPSARAAVGTSRTPRQPAASAAHVFQVTGKPPLSRRRRSQHRHQSSV